MGSGRFASDRVASTAMPDGPASFNGFVGRRLLRAFRGLGKIHTFTIIRYPPCGFEDQSPYVVALIDLVEGPRIIGRIQSRDGNIDIGATVRFAGKRGDAFDFALE